MDIDKLRRVYEAISTRCSDEGSGCEDCPLSKHTTRIIIDTNASEHDNVTFLLSIDGKPCTILDELVNKI